MLILFIHRIMFAFSYDLSSRKMWDRRQFENVASQTSLRQFVTPVTEVLPARFTGIGVGWALLTFLIRTLVGLPARY
jgi:hypothetical protein